MCNFCESLDCSMESDYDDFILQLTEWGLENE